MKIAHLTMAFLLPVTLAWSQAQNPPVYAAALDALDNHQWEVAAKDFDAASKGTRAEPALYWKAYALSKLARRDEALEAIAALRKAYPKSGWLQDAAALEMEIKQNSGQSVTAESQTDEEMKLLALNTLARSDPDRAVPAIESVLKRPHPPALERAALFVLAQSGSLEAQTAMERVARGGNPDLQRLAIRYLGDRKGYQGDFGKLLFETYSGTSDADVQREALMRLISLGDTIHLSQIHSPIAEYAVENLRLVQTRLGLGQKPEPTEAQKQARLAAAKLAAADYMAQQDSTARQGIIDAYAENGTVLIELARVEKNPLYKKKIVLYLTTLNTPEAREYLAELLK
jgi:hypothetical protein